MKDITTSIFNIFKYLSYLLLIAPIFTVIYLVVNTVNKMKDIDGGSLIETLEDNLDTWVTYRSVYYLLVTLIVVVSGLLTVIYSKLSIPTIGEEKANKSAIGEIIPNLIVGLVLMTFSYAFALLILNIVTTIRAL